MTLLPAPLDALQCALCAGVTAVAQQCHQCGLWLCPDCYEPWDALTCSCCRAVARHPAGRRHLRVVR